MADLNWGQSDPSQSILHCQFCNQSKGIKWKCTNCALLLCSVCSYNIHSKSQASKNHKIINIQECGTREEAEIHRTVDLENMTCNMHEDQRAVAYCNDCVVTICFKCSKESHQNHVIEEITDAYVIRQQGIKDFENEIEDALKLFDAEEDQLQKKIAYSESSKNYDEIKQSIFEQEKKLKDAISRKAKQLIDEVDEINKPITVKLKNKLLNIQQQKKKITEQKNCLKNALISHQAVQIFKTYGSIDQKLPETSVSAREFEMANLRFIPSQTDEEMSFGEVQKIPALHLKNSYVTKLKTVNKMINKDNNELLTAATNDNKFQRIKKDENSLTLMDDITTEVYDMALFNNGDVIISTGTSGIKLITQGGHLVPYKTFDGCKTLGVAVNDYNEIYVGLIETGGERMRKIVVLNSLNQIQHTFEWDRNLERLFSCPIRIAICTDEVFCVVDKLNNLWEGRVVALDHNGRVKWKYYGLNSDNSNQGKMFKPGNLTVTSKGLILISDMTEHNIHIINQCGHKITCITCSELGITLPYSLSIDTSGLLWIGCNTYKNASNTALIHVLEIQ